MRRLTAITNFGCCGFRAAPMQLQAVAGKRAEVRWVGKSGERIFGSNLRKLQSGLQHAVEAVAGKIAGMGAGGSLAVKHPHADSPRAGFFQGFHLAETDQRGKLISFPHDTFRGSGAARHGAADDVQSNLAQVGFEFLISGF